MLDKPNPTREEVLADLKAHQEATKNLPKVDFTHVNEIKDFVNAHQEIKSHDEANQVLDYLCPLQPEWQAYHEIAPSYLYTQIHQTIASAYYVLEDYSSAITILQECLNIINNSNNYQWLFAIKASLYDDLALCYYKIGNKESARDNIKEAISLQLSRYNNISYNDFAFYAFRPLNNYVLEGIRDNKISLSNPYTFNDPVDPALLSHLAMAIKDETNENEKEYLQLQLEVYERIRIMCLSRSQPLPTGEENRPIPKDPPFNEINKSTMWGYYANSHKGICIKYIFPASFTDHEHQKNGEVLILRNVVYQDKYDPNRDTFNYTEAFFTKSQEWSHEGECRLVYFQKDGIVADYPWKKLPEGCIREIYIGYAAKEEDKRKLMAILKDRPGIKLFQMQKSKTNLFELEPIEIRKEEYRYPTPKCAKIMLKIKKLFKCK